MKSQSRKLYKYHKMSEGPEVVCYAVECKLNLILEKGNIIKTSKIDSCCKLYLYVLTRTFMSAVIYLG